MGAESWWFWWVIHHHSMLPYTILAGNGVVPSRCVPAKDRPFGGEYFKAFSFEFFSKLETLLLAWTFWSGPGVFNETVSFSEKPVETLQRTQFGLCFAKKNALLVVSHYKQKCCDHGESSWDVTLSGWKEENHWEGSLWEIWSIRWLSLTCPC